MWIVANGEQIPRHSPEHTAKTAMERRAKDLDFILRFMSEKFCNLFLNENEEILANPSYPRTAASEKTLFGKFGKNANANLHTVSKNLPSLSQHDAWYWNWRNATFGREKEIDVLGEPFCRDRN